MALKQTKQNNVLLNWKVYYVTNTNIIVILDKLWEI